MNDKFDILRTYFGYTQFRNGQEKIIDAILSGQDSLGIMPTGAGKSLCFQIPALIFDGISIIISPLISLMKDQVNALTQAGVNAAFLNSSLTIRQQEKVLSLAQGGAYKILYVAPERLNTTDFMHFIKSAKIPFVGIDEAHCVSQWGQDFRPSYLKINEFIECLNIRPVIGGFTATATSRVSQDIVDILKLKKPVIVATGFDRPNLFFDVKEPDDKFSELLRFIKQRKEKSGIIYCLTRKTVEDVCSRLVAVGFTATRYHAGLSNIERQENQNSFQTDANNIMVATNAFGMGIDKSNVAYVVHYNMPKNLEGYYQEAGRAGRDGTPADCLLLYGAVDVITNKFLIEKSRDNDEVDEKSAAAFRLNEHERLRSMTFYCHTQSCLRGYILQYFGEKAKPSCEFCTNCCDDAEKIDITIQAQKILSCIKRMNERYGINLVIDTLRGSKNEKILNLGFNNLSTYGLLAEEKTADIRAIINYLLQEEYIELTISEFPVLKLGVNSKHILFNGKQLQMKKTKHIGEKSEKQPKVRAEYAKNEKLFDELKKLRSKLASSQSVPSFVIFTDATLQDICDKLPKNNEEFLKVSGVGNEKLKRYGKDFLKAVNDYNNMQ